MLLTTRSNTDVSRAGPCLLCHEWTQYGRPTKQHVKGGDAWLQKKMLRFAKPLTVTVKCAKHPLVRFNNHAITNIKSYLCRACFDRICLLRDSANYGVRAKPAEAQRPSSAERHNLRIMGYGEYLQTGHWKAVRAAKLKGNHKCADCGSETELHVHHVSYIHRGDELEHLDDLLVVCAKCHADRHGRQRPDATPIV